MSPHFRPKLLFDENMPPRDRFPRTNGRFTIKHIIIDLKRKNGLKDPQVYKLACKEKMLIVTINEKDFAKMAKKNKESGIISVSPNMSNEHIDKKLLSLLNKKGKGLYGKLTKITGESQSQ